MWWKTLIREPNHGERFLPLLLTGALAAYLLIFWYIGKENYAAELARKEELLWKKRQDSIRMAEYSVFDLPNTDPSLPSGKVQLNADSPTQPAPVGKSALSTESRNNPVSTTATSVPASSVPGTAIVNSPAPRNKYHLIAGSFSTDANARNAAANYRKQGFDASVVLRRNPDGSVSHLVSLKSFGSHEEATGFRNEARKNSRIESWIYTSQP